jgi:hypothetical protein
LTLVVKSPTGMNHTDELSVSAIRRRLIASVVLALSAAAAVLAAILTLAARADWWNGFAAATIVSLLAAAGSLPLLSWGLAGSLNRAVAATFASAAVRLIVSLAGCMLAVSLGGYPKVPTFILMVPYYFAVLAAETLIVSRAIWNRPADTDDKTS